LGRGFHGLWRTDQAQFNNFMKNGAAFTDPRAVRPRAFHAGMKVTF
jgi:hypothetical protein